MSNEQWLNWEAKYVPSFGKFPLKYGTQKYSFFLCVLLLNKLSLRLQMTTQKLAKAYNFLVLKKSCFLWTLSQGNDGRHSGEESGSFWPQDLEQSSQVKNTEQCLMALSANPISMQTLAQTRYIFQGTFFLPLDFSVLIYTKEKIDIFQRIIIDMI